MAPKRSASLEVAREKNIKKTKINAQQDVDDQPLHPADRESPEILVPSGGQANVSRPVGSGRMAYHSPDAGSRLNDMGLPRKTSGLLPLSAFPITENIGIDLEKISGDGYTAQDEGRKVDKSFRSQICIFVPKDATDEHALWTVAILDTQAKDNIMFKREAEKLGLQWHCTTGVRYRGLGRDEIEAIGCVTILFAFDGRPDRKYRIDVDVLEDAFSKAERAPFSLLIGSKKIVELGLLQVDETKIPKMFPIRKLSYVHNA